MFNIKELLTDSGKKISLNEKTQLRVVVIGDDSYPLYCKEPIDYSFENDNGIKITIKAKGEVAALIPCDRCLSEVRRTFNIDYECELELESDGVLKPEALEIAEYIEGDNLDTDKLIADEILIHWPAKNLCKEDCKGICPKCGFDLNLGECGCDRFVPDPRMAVIKDIFNQSKEV